MVTTMTVNRRLLYILWRDWTWWAWAATALLLLAGSLGQPAGFLAALGLTALQFLVMRVRDKHLSSFPVQLRAGYLILLALCYIPELRWLYWLPTLGTLALVIFGYCPMARMLSLLPWNRYEPISLDLLRRTFLSRPDLSRVSEMSHSTCPGGLCSIAAQVEPRNWAKMPHMPSVGSDTAAGKMELRGGWIEGIGKRR